MKGALIVGGTVLSLVVSWIAIENHFTSEGELMASEQRQEQQLQMFQMKTNTTFDIFLLDKLNQEIMTYKRLYRENPADMEIKDMLMEAVKSRDAVKKRIEERLKTK